MNDERPPLRAVPAIPAHQANEELIAASREALGLPEEPIQLDSRRTRSPELDDTEMDLDDLGFLAERLLKTAVANFDFEKLVGPAASLLTDDEGDQRIIRQLIRNASFTVHVDPTGAIR